MSAASETEASASSKPETKGPETVVPSISQQKGIMLPLGNERYLVYSQFKGADRVHIREYKRKNGFLLASKVGICMTPKRFAALRFHLPQIDESVKQQQREGAAEHDLKLHIGGPLYVTVQQGFPCVNFRKYFFPTGEIEAKPSKFGIALRHSEWEALKARVEELIAMNPELGQVEMCSNGLDHFNQEGYFSCTECNFYAPGFNPYIGF